MKWSRLLSKATSRVDHSFFGVADDRAGIPATNPNLTPEIEAKVAEVAALIKAGTVVVSDNGAGLIK